MGILVDSTLSGPAVHETDPQPGQVQANGISRRAAMEGALSPMSKNGFRIPVEVEEFDEEDPQSEDDKDWGPIPEVVVTKVDERDKNTSDDWIPRHPELVRLTGRHPFNCEPPLHTLMEVLNHISSFSTQNLLPVISSACSGLLLAMYTTV